MRVKMLFILVIVLVALPALAGAKELKINDIPAKENDTLTFYKSELMAGKITLFVEDEKLQSAEVTFDGGTNWEEMKARDDGFYFAHRPRTDGEFITEFMLTYEDGTIETYRPFVTIFYFKMKPDDAVLELIEKMKLYYENENESRFLSLFSARFPNRTRFAESIQNDFFNYRNIRLFSKVLRQTFDRDYEGAVWDVFWEKRFDNVNNEAIESTGTIAMRFANEGGTWLVSAMRENTVFGSTLMGKPDLTLTANDIVNLGDQALHNTTITIHNRGNRSATNIPVQIYNPNVGTLLIAVTLTTTIEGGNSYTFATGLNTPVTAGDVARVVIDPNNVIDESNESNNSATKTF